MMCQTVAFAWVTVDLGKLVLGDRAVAAILVLSALVWFARGSRRRRFDRLSRKGDEALKRKDYAEAERILRSTWEQAKSFRFSRHECEAIAIHNLAHVITQQERDADAEPLLRRLIEDDQS